MVRFVFFARTMVMTTAFLGIAGPPPGMVVLGGEIDSAVGEPEPDHRSFDVETTLQQLIDEEDTDQDAKITVDDPKLKRDGQGDRRFKLIDSAGREFEVSGTYPLSNLLQELILARDEGRSHVPLEVASIYEPPTRRISRLIRELYWDGLTRRVDAEHLQELLLDEKAATGETRYLYVPHSDTVALSYYREASEAHPEWNLEVVRLPDPITPEYVRSLDGRHGILALALRRTPDGRLVGTPFVVPGGRFNEMYGWDSYFIALGLLADGRVDLAQAMVDNFVYQITYYGKILNANRTYYLTRSQPPFLTSMAMEVYEALPPTPESREWLATVLRAAVREYREVWTGPGRLMQIGLSRYHGDGIGPPPEVEPGHFDAIYLPFARGMGIDVREYERRYRAGFDCPTAPEAISEPALDRFFVNDRALRESGHDTTYRWDQGEGRGCADFATVDLNCLLYKYEIDLARALQEKFGGRLPGVEGPDAEAGTWTRRALERRTLILRLLQEPETGLFFDYEPGRGHRTNFLAVTTLYPLWACHDDDPRTRLLTPEQAARLVAAALGELEVAGGLAGCTEVSRGPIAEPERPQRQWDYPNGWAPHQMLAWRGLLNYGFEDDALRLAYRWLYSLTRNAVDYNGTVPEKLDVVRRSHQVFAEYGNVGTKFSYITREGFGWTNASYQVGLELLPDELRDRLDNLIPPEWAIAEEMVTP